MSAAGPAMTKKPPRLIPSMEMGVAPPYVDPPPPPPTRTMLSAKPPAPMPKNLIAPKVQKLNLPSYKAPPPPRPPPSNVRYEEDVQRVGSADLLRRLQKSELDLARVTSRHAQALQEVNRANSQLQTQAKETRSTQNEMQHLQEDVKRMHEENRRLMEDNQELRDLCCFLDDDRQKGRKLAREWQRFGRYTAAVMRQEVATYQAKLGQLEARQQELLRDNLELKELCLYLDEERNQAVCHQCGASLAKGPRDDGDGSSTGTITEEGIAPRASQISATTRERLAEERSHGLLNEQILQYIRSLEQKVATFEPHDGRPPATWNKSPLLNHNGPVDSEQSSRPEPVTRALRVLEVCERLEGMAVETDQEDVEEVENSTDLGERERALVREMCNVVWRKLEDAAPQPR